MNYVKEINDHNYSKHLFGELLNIIDQFNLHDHKQISLTSIEGNNDWSCSIGKILDLPYKEKFYSIVNEALRDTYIEKLILENKKFYRWRAMKISPHSTYSVHKDGQSNITNVRCHIPIVTNENAHLIFFGKDKKNKNPNLYNLECGKIYEVNTTEYHSAINFGEQDRWHIIGVKYEDINYWT